LIGRVLEQDRVEFPAIDMKGVVAIDARLVSLDELNLGDPFVTEPAISHGQEIPRFRRCPGGAELLREIRRVNLFEGSDLEEHRCGSGNERLADMRPGEYIALEYDHGQARPGEVRRG